MRTIHICLALNETDYSNALARSLMRVSRFFSIGDRTVESYDLLLTDEPSLSAGKLVYFTDERAEERIDEDRKIFIIYKYQHTGRISKILKLAHSLYSETEPFTDECEETTIISVCATSGGTGCTSVAMGLCNELSRFRQKRVLYLNLEEFESTNMLFHDDHGGAQNITGYLYRVLSGQGGSIPSAAGYLAQNEYDTFAFRPSRGRNPLRELGESEFMKFMNSVLREGLFSHVIMDCGTGMDDAIASAMRLSCNICHVSSGSTCQKRMQNYLEAVGHRTGDTDHASWLFVKNFHHTPNIDNGEIQFQQDDTGISIPCASSSFAMVDGHLKIGLDKSFGKGIRTLVARIGPV